MRSGWRDSGFRYGGAAINQQSQNIKAPNTIIEAAS
jgi:hypothetical protein